MRNIRKRNTSPLELPTDSVDNSVESLSMPDAIVDAAKAFVKMVTF